MDKKQDTTTTEQVSHVVIEPDWAAIRATGNFNNFTTTKGVYGTLQDVFTALSKMEFVKTYMILNTNRPMRRAFKKINIDLQDGKRNHIIHESTRKALYEAELAKQEEAKQAEKPKRGRKPKAAVAK